MEQMRHMKLLASLCLSRAEEHRKPASNRVKGWSGSAPLKKTGILITDVPSNYIQINSGLGEAPPLNIVVLPVLF
jgi:hypothetical protein